MNTGKSNQLTNWGGNKMNDKDIALALSYLGYFGDEYNNITNDGEE